MWADEESPISAKASLGVTYHSIGDGAFTALVMGLFVICVTLMQSQILCVFLKNNTEYPE